MSSFQINGQDPPVGKAIPRQAAYEFHIPEVTGQDGLGRPIVGTAGVPWVQFYFKRIPMLGWNWYCGFLNSGHRMYGELTSIRLPNPYDYTVPGGPDWVTFTGDDIVLEAPIFESISFGSFFGVTITVRGLD